MPFVAYVHAKEPDPAGRRPVWQPDWRLWRWVLAAIFCALAADRSEGVVALVLVIAVFALACKALDELLPDGDGLSQHRQ